MQRSESYRTGTLQPHRLEKNSLVLRSDYETDTMVDFVVQFPGMLTWSAFSSQQQVDSTVVHALHEVAEL